MKSTRLEVLQRLDTAEAVVESAREYLSDWLRDDAARLPAIVETENLEGGVSLCFPELEGAEARQEAQMLHTMRQVAEMESFLSAACTRLVEIKCIAAGGPRSSRKASFGVLH